MSLGFPLLDAGPDLALLFLAMRIITTQPQDGVRPAELPLYGCVKRVLAMVESSGLVSLMYLQALVLVALYEFGHAIYPAAWMTVGACVRYADMLGLPNFKDGNVTLGICVSKRNVRGSPIRLGTLTVRNRVRPHGRKPRSADVSGGASWCSTGQSVSAATSDP